MSPSYRGYVYLIGSQRFGWYKIGKSKHANIRINDLGILLPFRVELFCLWGTDDETRLEREMHIRHEGKNLHGEWFLFDWLELAKIAQEPTPYFGVRIENAPTIVNTIKEDRSLDSDLLKRQKKQRHLALWNAICELMDERGMERTKSNREIVRREILDSQLKEIVLSSKTEFQVAARTAKTNRVGLRPH